MLQLQSRYKFQHTRAVKFSMTKVEVGSVHLHSSRINSVFIQATKHLGFKLSRYSVKARLSKSCPRLST